MKLPPDDVPPERVDRIHVRRVARERRDVGHAGVEVCGTDGVSERLLLLQHRPVVLIRRTPDGPEVLASAHVDEVLRELEVLRISSRLVETAEADLDFLVSRSFAALSLAEAERLRNEVGVPGRHVEKRALARHLVVRHGGLVEMAHVVQLACVAVSAERLRAHHRRLVPKRAGGVEISVLLLRAGDLGDEVVEVAVELGIGMLRERVGRAFDDLEDVGVVPGHALEAALLAPRGPFEVRYAPRLLALAEVGLDSHEPVRLDAREPEPARHLHVVQPGRRVRIPSCERNAGNHRQNQSLNYNSHWISPRAGAFLNYHDIAAHEVSSAATLITGNDAIA